jgi:hypothetical protein
MGWMNDSQPLPGPLNGYKHGCEDLKNVTDGNIREILPLAASKWDPMAINTKGSEEEKGGPT